MENIALATILMPFIGAALVLCLPERTGKWLAALVALMASVGTLALAQAFAAGGKVPLTVDVFSLAGMPLVGITVDRLSTLVAIAVVVLGFLVVLYSTAYMSEGNREHPHVARPRYYAYLLVFIGAMAGLVLSSTLLGQLVFFEITGACSWGLIGYYQKPKALKSALKALLVTHVAALGLYVAAGWLFAQTGSFALTGIAALAPQAKIVVFLGIMLAAWGKSAQLPLHVWLPDAMEAPTPVSAYLHAASMVKVGVYIFARALYSAGPVPEVIGWIGAVMALATMLYGFAMYLPQKDMKRLLAYSTIAQLSYIFLGLSLSVFGSKLAFDGAVAHIFNHAFAKSLFFLVAGALSYTCGTRVLPNLRGVLKKSPLLGLCFGVAALSISGVPPFNGFFSKFAILAAGFELSRAHWLVLPLVLLALIESVCSFGWLMSWFGKVVPGEPSEAVASATPVPWAMRVVFVVLLTMCLASSFIAASWLA
ncbi:hydrogenase 4 subunit D [Paludibacterium sp.]|uniref:hydrogenase 4 subunit D n=1 Tax=Paludibacterium sp. TaxID=1917523 RepID=UPI0025D62EF6|nr:hydrogenase 4 subunit D [Paludibacterium sp.]MBV8648816.1 hydrogenase 4 subunit D [Paludibacterium sp.]